MASITSLTGTVLLEQDGFPATSLQGLQVEIRSLSFTPPAEGAFVGSGIIDGAGKFSVPLNERNIPKDGDPLVINIYKGKVLVKQDTQPMATPIKIYLNPAEYDSAVPDNTLKPSGINYIVITGKVTIGDGHIAAVPVDDAAVRVVAVNSVFRNVKDLLATTPHAFGRYRLKIPYRLLFPSQPPGAATVPNRAAQIAVELRVNDTPVVSGAYFSADTDEIEKDLHIDTTEGYSGIFYTELDQFADIIATATGLNIADLYTVDPEGAEPGMLASSTGLGLEEVRNMVLAAHLARDTGIDVDPAYALIRPKIADVLHIPGLSADIIRDTITDAKKKMIVGSGIAIDPVISTLQGHRADDLGNTTDEDGNTLQTLLDAAVGDSTLTRDFLDFSIRYQQADVETFWNALTAEIGAAPVKTIQQGLQLLSVTGLQPETTQSLRTAIGTADLPDYLSGLTLSDWQNIVNDVCERNQKLCVPVAIRGDATDYKDQTVRDTYAQALYDINGITFLHQAMKQRITADSTYDTVFRDRTGLASFLKTNADYDVRTDSVWSLDLENGSDLKDDLMVLQNVSRLGLTPDSVSAYLKSGIRSSSDLAALPPPDGKVVPRAAAIPALENVATLEYNRAVANDMVMKLGYIQLLPGNYVEQVTKAWSTNIWLPAKTPVSDPTTPDYESLFGSTDFCACCDCTSLFSPAAYLTDILNFLKTKISNTQAYNEYIRRRPDIINIDLSCENDTPLPYVDLVNELLELIILHDIKLNDAGHSGLFIPASFQTRNSAEILAAYPEHVYKDSNGSYADYADYTLVYDTRLKKAIYPYSLPFDLALAETRVYFSYLGFSRYTLMDRYKPANYQDIQGTDTVNEYNLKAEYLGLSRFQADIITKVANADLPADTELFYGFPSGTANWYNLLCNDLKMLISRVGISYTEFLQFLVTDFLNRVSTGTGARPFAIVAKSGFPADTCNVDELYLAWSDTTGTESAARQAFFDKLYRFVRLYRATSWNIYQCDVVLTGLGATDISLTVFLQFAQARQWCDRYALSPERVSVLWSDINTQHFTDFSDCSQAATASLYDSLFRNRAVSAPPDPNFADPANIVGTLQDNIGTILGGLNITEKDLNTYTGNNLGQATTLSLLSGLMRTQLLCTMFGFRSFADLNTALSIWFTAQPSGSVADRMAAYQTLFDRLQRIEDHEMNVYQLLYLLRHEDPNNVFLPLDSTVQPFYEAMRLDLRNSLGTSRQGIVLSEVQISLLQNIIVQHFADAFALTAATAAYILGSLTGVLVDGSNVPILEALATTEFIYSTSDIIPDNSSSPQGAGINFKSLYIAYYLSGKIATVTTYYTLSTDLLTRLQNQQASLLSLDFSALPTSPGLGSVSLTEGFFALDDWIRTRDTLSIQAAPFLKLLDLSAGHGETGQPVYTKNDWTAWAVTNLQWNADDLLFLAGDNNTDGVLQLHYDAASAAGNNFNSGQLLITLNLILQSSQRMGMRPSLVLPELLPTVDMALSAIVRHTAKARHSDAEWMKIAEPLQDELREQQRQALVAYIVARPSIIQGNNMLWDDTNGLYAYLLIDVEMQPCMQTSRTKQAISSTQLFVDRVILSVESYNGSTTIISIPDTMVAQWESWRKWYRIWEANRKIFFYPENWIEPELRDNKTPLFKDLETALEQDSITQSVVENAYLAYLEGLEEIAHLTPVSSYTQTVNGSEVIHVFSRTDASPHRYYYRRFEDQVWTPWEKVGLTINSDQVVPVMWNNRLYLFWLTFQKKKPSDLTIGQQQKANVISAHKSWSNTIDNYIDDPDDTAYYYWNITLNWSEYQDGKWQRQDSCSEIMTIDMGLIQMNAPSYDSYGAGAASTAAKIRMLTDGDTLEPDEFFKNRIYLYTPQEQAFLPQVDGITFNLLFPTGLDENAIGLHTFLWVGNNSNDPYVLHDSDRGHQVLAPTGTLIDKMQFVEDPAANGKLNVDAYTMANIGYYSASVNAFFENFPRAVRNGNATILNATPLGTYKVVARATNNGELGDNPMKERFFFQDSLNTYYVVEETESVQKNTALWNYQLLQGVNDTSITSIANTLNIASIFYSPALISMGAVTAATTVMSNALLSSSAALTQYVKKYRFYTFYHAQIKSFLTAYYQNGLDGLLTLANQSQTDTMAFYGTYQPTALVSASYPANNVQFGISDPYSIYNWELFFHIPMRIAGALSNNQQFEDARKWYHYIFNPTSNTDMNGNINTTNQRFWKFYPFYAESATPAETLGQLLIDINNSMPEVLQQINVWENHPFNPHIIARMRVLAYMKNVLMKYIDNLIAWGDQLFSRDTIESINEATQLYILASNLLGDRPLEIPARVQKKDYTFLELTSNGNLLDAMSNAMVNIESFFSPNAGPSFVDTSTGKGATSEMLRTLYFCLPENDKLLGYWDTVADRLFKIRNCMNIAGEVRSLPLYEPPIDPALLVRATAMGVNINTVLNDIDNARPPVYRFGYNLQKANELVAELKSLGGALLAALEKKDAETLALLRSSNEVQLQQRILDIKEDAINEAQANLDNLTLTKENVQIRYNYYSSRQFQNSYETENLAKLTSAKNWQIAQGATAATAAAICEIPELHIQGLASGSSHGGLHLANVFNAISAGIGIKVAIDNFSANSASIMGGYTRRMEDWQFQAQSAAKELEQMDQQILAAEIRLDMAQKDYNNQDLIISQRQQEDDFMHSKYTNEELYTWMSAQIAATYFQTYQLAFEMAKKAEYGYSYELPLAGIPSTGFIKFGYWDTLRKGLLTGEQMQFDLHKMETSYMEANVRELELTKNISLAANFPDQLIALRNTGTCTVNIPELLFDLDYPGQYLRRIKSVSISIPCVAGPYTTVNCTLALASGKYRKDTSLTGGYAEHPDGTGYDSRFSYQENLAGQEIATSTAQNDSGVFELNFRDERYLPFEGIGAISSWTLSLPGTYRQFDYTTITDVVLHVRYTARNGGTPLQTAAAAYVQSVFSSLQDSILQNYVAVKAVFSNAWELYKSLYPADSSTRMLLPMTQDNFPFFAANHRITVTGISVALLPKVLTVLADSYKLFVRYYYQAAWYTVSTDLTGTNAYQGYLAITEGTPLLFLANTKNVQVWLTASDGSTPANMDALLDNIFWSMDYAVGAALTTAGTNDPQP